MDKKVSSELVVKNISVRGTLQERRSIREANFYEVVDAEKKVDLKSRSC